MVAQSQPTSRAQQQVIGTSSGAGGPLLGDMMDPSPGPEPTWTPFFNPYSDHGHYNPFFSNPWSGGTGGIPNADGSGTAQDAMATGNPDMYALVGLPGTSNAASPGSMGGPSPGESPGFTPPQSPPRPPLWDDPNHIPGPGRYSTANETDPAETGAASPVPGSQIDPGQPAPQVDVGGPSQGDPGDIEPLPPDFSVDWGPHPAIRVLRDILDNPETRLTAETIRANLGPNGAQYNPPAGSAEAQSNYVGGVLYIPRRVGEPMGELLTFDQQLDRLQFGLDVAGVVDPSGTADGANARPTRL